MVAAGHRHQVRHRHQFRRHLLRELLPERRAADRARRDRPRVPGRRGGGRSTPRGRPPGVSGAVPRWRDDSVRGRSRCRRRQMLEGLDDLDAGLLRRDEIRAFQQTDRTLRPVDLPGRRCRERHPCSGESSDFFAFFPCLFSGLPVPRSIALVSFLTWAASSANWSTMSAMSTRRCRRVCRGRRRCSGPPRRPRSRSRPSRHDRP